MDQTGSGSLVFQAIDYFWCPIKKIQKPIKKIKLMIIAFYQTHRKKIVEGESYEGVSIKKSNMWPDVLEKIYTFAHTKHLKKTFILSSVEVIIKHRNYTGYYI